MLSEFIHIECLAPCLTHEILKVPLDRRMEHQVSLGGSGRVLQRWRSLSWAVLDKETFPDWLQE